MHGLSTLNRLLGKKNKEVSRSTSNLSKSHSNLESSSQHNKKIPILNNAPFEQTFRVTVYLPKNQLYVERIGAKTKLDKLMNDVCDNKNLSIDKYEFRHPADMSQVFDNDKTIGEVGLNELRLVLKSESRYNGDFHRYHSRPDEIIKYKPSNVAESVSSSEISRSNLKNTSKTSPYSSTNSLNSLDSTGMNSSNKVQQPVAPIRKKKRAAPRPPSENSIPEQEIFSTSTLNVFKEPHSILPRKNFHVSSPQLYNNNINNNNYEIAQKSDSNNNQTELRSISSRLNAITRPSSLHFGSNTEIVKNLPERQRNNSESSEIQNIMRDSGSMENSLERAKKKSPAPVPPTRKMKPTPSPRTIQEDMKSITEIKEVDEQENVNTQKTVGEIPIDNSPKSTASSKTEDENGNVSKVLLNNKSKSSLEKTEGPISIQILSSEVNVEQQSASSLKQQQQQEEKSKESIKLPVVSKVNINHRGDEMRSGSEEEEEEMTVNIYNVTKSVVTCEKPAIIKDTNSNNKKISVVEGEQKHVIIENNNKIVKEETPNVTKVEECQRSPSPEWTYTLPAPPIVGNSLESNNSNVNNNNNSPTDQKSVVGNKYFSDYTSTVNDNETILSDSNTTVVSAETHIQPIINDRRKVLDDSFIINPNDYTKPSTTAAAILLDNQSDKSSAEVITSDLEDGYLGNNNKDNINISNDNEISVIEEVVVSKPKPVEDIQKSRLITIARSDSFHSIGQQKRNEYYDGMIRGTNFNALPQRSTSFLSLVHSQKAEMRSSSLTATSIKQDLNVPYNRQKSTSELSISDVPSLQSLEVIKNILNCRKSSLQEANRKSALSDDINNYKSAAPIEEPKNIHSSSTLIQTSTALTSTTSTSKKKIEVKSTEKVIYNTSIETRDIKKLETQKSEPVFVERNKNNNSIDTSNNNNNVKKSETQWRYSGPPKINFSTWNERPKVEVSVMSDEDYIFGGSAHSTTLPRDFKNQGINQYSQNQNVDSVDSFVKKSYSTVMVKNENKEAERHLPKVLGVEYKKDVVVLRNKDTTTSATASEIINRNNNNNNNGNNSTKTLISIKQRPVTMDYSSAISSSTTKTTLNSPNYQNQFVSFNNNNNNNNITNSSNSKKFTPIVHGFSKLDNISETQSDVKSLPIATNKITDANNEKRAEAPMIPVKPSYLRSTSAGGDMSRNLKLSSVKNVTNSDNDASYDENPYSSTLRRTGLIEKMLNNDKKTESMFGRVLDKPKSTANNPFNNNSVQMIEEKVEKVAIRQLSQPVTSSTNNNIPPPPPPMIFRKSAPVVISGQMSEGETRNELLDAIKNFNKDSLRRK